jgi:hypothetical protein
VSYFPLVYFLFRRFLLEAQFDLDLPAIPDIVVPATGRSCPYGPCSAAKGRIVRRGSIGLHIHSIFVDRSSIAPAMRLAALIRASCIWLATGPVGPARHACSRCRIYRTPSLTFWNNGTLRLGHSLTGNSVRGLVLLVGDVQEARILADHSRRVIDRAASRGDEAGLL